MRKLLLVICCFLATSAYAGIGTDTTFTVIPECVDPNGFYSFATTLNFRSPDGETLKGAQFWIGDTWEFGEVFVPSEGSIGGFWVAHVNPVGNVVEWEFTRDFGEPGGGVPDGESVTFEFEATTGNPDDFTLEFHIFGDGGGASEPYVMGWQFEIDNCADDDDDTDDDTDDDSDDDIDDDVDDDADDDSDDWHSDDDTADDTASDDTTGDDDTEPNYDYSDDENSDDDDGGGSGCGC